MADAVVLYAGAVGITLEQTTVATWLHLVVVLFLEVGSAFGLVAARAVSNSPHYEATTTIQEPAQETAEPALDQPSEPTSSRASTETAVVDYLKANGGRLNRSERGLAKLIGSSRSTTKRALNSLVAAGLIVLASEPSGTDIRLIA